MGDTMWVKGVNLLEVNDELKLHELLDHSEDYEDRKIIRARLKDVIAENRIKREEFIRRREEEREEFLRARVRDADEQKRRTLAMYDAMAKSAPAGGNKTLDVSILRGEGSGRSTPTLTNSPGAKVDLVEQSIRQRQKEADERKKKTLAAYDQAARSGPAGSARFVDFDAVREQDVHVYENSPRYTSTFQMRGGIPIAGPVKVRQAPLPAAEQPRDLEEEAIRRRQREADERKRRTLEAYDKAAKSRPAGTPVSVYIPYDDSIEPIVELAPTPTAATVGQKPLAQKPQPQQNQQQTRQVTTSQVITKNVTTAPQPKPQPPLPQQQQQRATATVTLRSNQQRVGNTTTTTTVTTRKQYVEEEDEEEESEEEDY